MKNKIEKFIRGGKKGKAKSLKPAEKGGSKTDSKNSKKQIRNVAKGGHPMAPQKMMKKPKSIFGNVFFYVLVILAGYLIFLSFSQNQRMGEAKKLNAVANGLLRRVKKSGKRGDGK